MKLDAILHVPMSEYCHGLDENHIVYRMRSANDKCAASQPNIGTILGRWACGKSAARPWLCNLH